MCGGGNGRGGRRSGERGEESILVRVWEERGRRESERTKTLLSMPPKPAWAIIGSPTGQPAVGHSGALSLPGACVQAVREWGFGVRAMETEAEGQECVL